MKYVDTNHEIYYDRYMLQQILSVNLSSLKEKMKRYNFPQNSYIKYQNKHLYKEQAVLDFIVFLVTHRLENDINRLSKKLEITNGI